MITATMLNRPFAIPSEIGYAVINTAAAAGAGAICGRALNANVAACAIIAGSYCFLTYIPSRIMAHSKQLSVTARLLIGGIYESCIISVSILALRRFDVIGKFGAIFLASVGVTLALITLLKLTTVYQIEKRHPNPSLTALSYIV